MAYTSGTASHYKELLATLATFVAANGWTVLEQTETLVSLRGEGLSGLDEIYASIGAYENTTAGYYNWQVCGSWGWRSGRGVGYHPMSSAKRYIYLWNAPIPYWMFAHAGRFIMVAKIGSVFQILHVGFGLPPATEQQYPYPLIIGACGTSSTGLYSTTGTGNSMFWANNGLNGVICRPGGDWDQVGPASCPPKWITSDVTAAIGKTYDDEYLLEEIFITDANRTSIYAALDGIYKVSGLDNSSENIITVDGVNHLVIQDVYRVGIGDYCAIKMV